MTLQHTPRPTGSYAVKATVGHGWTAAQARAAMSAARPAALDTLAPPHGALLIVAPHPDDESLGCGGLIALAADAGRTVRVALLTDGAASHPNSRLWPPARLAALRHGEMLEAMAALAGAPVRVDRFGAPDGGLEAHEIAATAWLADFAADVPVAAVFTTWIADPHPDHKAAFHIAARVAVRRSAPLFAYPVWGLTLPDDADAGPVGAACSLDICDAVDRKRAAVAAHRSQTTSLIDDDPEGFRLSPEDLDRHLGPQEIFIRFPCDGAGDPSPDPGAMRDNPG